MIHEERFALAEREVDRDLARLERLEAEIAWDREHDENVRRFWAEAEAEMRARLDADLDGIADAPLIDLLDGECE